MNDLAFVLESYTIPEYEIATEGLLQKLGGIILGILKLLKKRIFVLIGIIVAIIMAAKGRGGTQGTTTSNGPSKSFTPPGGNNPPSPPSSGSITAANVTQSQLKKLQKIISSLTNTVSDSTSTARTAFEYLKETSTIALNFNLMDNNLRTQNPAQTPEGRLATFKELCMNLDLKVGMIKGRIEEYDNLDYSDDVKIQLDPNTIKNLTDCKNQLEKINAVIVDVYNQFIKFQKSANASDQGALEKIATLEKTIKYFPETIGHLYAESVRTLQIVNKHIAASVDLQTVAAKSVSNSKATPRNSGPIRMRSTFNAW